MAATTEMENDSAGKVKDLSQRLKTFYTDVRSEMKKVTRPTWKEVQGTTLVVLATVAVFGVFFYFTDMFLTYAVDGIITHFSK